MSAILLESEIVHYEVLGKGRPILFLHGWVGSWRYWIPVMQAASVSYRAYAIDLWGFGDSAKDSRRYFLKEQVRLLDGFLDQLGVLRIAIVGHGLGAILAMLYAAMRPDMVDRVMAVSLPLEEEMIHNRLRSDMPGMLGDWLLGRLSTLEPARADAPKADAQAIRMSLSSLREVNLPGVWRMLTTPYVLINGMNDLAVQPPRGDQLALLPDRAAAVTFEQSGHFPMLDESSKFNRLLTDFLALTSGESPRDLHLKEEWKRRVR